MKAAGKIIGREKNIFEQMLTEDDCQDMPGDQIGAYTLVERLGEGGFGVVWRATTTSPIRQEVALKVLKAGMDSRHVISRFQRERQALAGMNHPNIAALFNASTTSDGRPCFAMELVSGEPITRYCERRGLSIREKLDLFHQVCDAVQHAHQRGVIHRDLKPGNILVSETDGRALPKVIDFGISKMVDPGLNEEDATLLTRQDMFLGTPLYMSPEQLDGIPDVDTRSDIYALGMVLYELLTCQQPFDIAALTSRSMEEMRRVLKEDRPARPSLAVRKNGGASETDRLPKDLDWITLCALEKERERRYSTAAELAADIRRFLEHSPVAARPPSVVYLTSCWVRRHQALALAACVSLAALFSGLAVALWQARVADISRARAEQEAAQSRQTAAFLTSLLDDVATEVNRGLNPEALREGLSASQKKLDGISDPDLQISLQKQISHLYESMSERKLSIPSLERLARLTAGRHGEGSQEAHDAAINHLFAMVNHGDRTEAAKRLAAMKERFEDSGKYGSLEWFDVQNLLTRAWVKLRNIPLAQAAADEAATAATKHRLPPERHFAILLTRTEALHLTGRHSDALKQHEETRALLEKNGILDVYEKDFLRRVAASYSQAGKHGRATELQRELVNKVRSGDRQRLFREYGTLVTYASRAGLHEEAIAHAREALVLARQPDQSADAPLRRAEAADSLRHLASALGHAGRHAESVSVARDALAIAFDDGNGQRITKGFMLLAERLEAAGRLEEAHAAYRSSYQSHTQRNASYKDRIYDLHAMAAIRRRQGRHADALKHHQEAWRQTMAEPSSKDDPDFVSYVAAPALECWKKLLSSDPNLSPPQEVAAWEAARTSPPINASVP